MKKILYATVLMMGASLHSSAQQLQTSAFYELQGIYHNPAMAGTANQNLAGISYKTQWGNFSGAPRTAAAFGSFSFPNQKIGVGAVLYSDRTGPTARNGVQLSFAKHIVMANESKFSIGIEARGVQYTIDKAKLEQALSGDPLLTSASNKTKFDAGFGLAYVGKHLTLGASVSQLIQSKLDMYDNTNEAARLYRHYYFHGNYKWNVDESTTITPSALFIFLPNAPSDLQLGARVEHKKLFWWSLGYRLKQSFMLGAGININKNIGFGYQYIGYTNPGNTFSGNGSGHEAMLKFGF